jgi:hypothetical protein
MKLHSSLHAIARPQSTLVACGYGMDWTNSPRAEFIKHTVGSGEVKR